MFLIILGDGVVANVVLAKTKGNNSGWIVITTGWAMAVMVGVFISFLDVFLMYISIIPNNVCN